MPSKSIDQLFLGGQPDRAIGTIRTKHGSAFNLADELASYLHWKLDDVGASKWSLQQGLQSALLVRLITAFQGCVLTAERGMEAEATLLARKVLEVTFRVVAVSRSEAMAARYLSADKVNRRNLLKKLRSLTSIRRTDEENASLAQRHAEADALVRSEGAQETTTLQYAEAAGLLDYYNTAYAHFSQSAHVNVSDLDELIETDSNGSPVAFRFGPDIDFQSKLLATAVESVVMSLEAIFECRDGHVPVGVRTLRRKMENLFAEMERGEA